MMRPAGNVRVYLCAQPVDMRQSINGLSAQVQGVLALDPFSTHLFAFINRGHNKLKILYWEHNGFVLWYKRLERECFWWPKPDETIIALDGQQLNWLLDGQDMDSWKPHKPSQYQYIS